MSPTGLEVRAKQNSSLEDLFSKTWEILTSVVTWDHLHRMQCLIPRSEGLLQTIGNNTEQRISFHKFKLLTLTQAQRTTSNMRLELHPCNNSEESKETSQQPILQIKTKHKMQITCLSKCSKAAKLCNKASTISKGILGIIKGEWTQPSRR